MILAIDIGGTKFSMAVFDGDAMVRRVSRATDAGGGRAWMVAQIAEIAGEWRREFALERCGIGFGGPVNFAAQRVVLSTHVGGWRDFDLCAFVKDAAGVPAVMDNDANVGAMGEAEFGAGQGCSPLFYMTLSTGIGGGIWEDGRIWRGADSYGGEIGHLTIRPDGPECLCGARGCLERLCCGLWLERDYGMSARRVTVGCGVCETLRSGPGAGPEGGDHAAQSAAHRDWRRDLESRRPPLYTAAAGVAAPDHQLVRRAD